MRTLQNKPFYTVTYELGNGEKHEVQVLYIGDYDLLIQHNVMLQAKEGDNLLDVVINNDIDIDGFGACEGTLACSTCHLIFTPEDFSKIDEEATDEELDMLVRSQCCNTYTYSILFSIAGPGLRTDGHQQTGMSSVHD